MMDVARRKFVDAIGMLNDEGFNAVSWMVYQQAKTAGGYTDHVGWARVLRMALELPFIRQTQAKFDEETAKLDQEPPTQVIPK